MNYRQLQAELKRYRVQCLSPRSFKLNQKKVILQAEYDRIIDLYSPTIVETPTVESITQPTNNNELTFGVEIEVLRTPDLNRELIEAALQAEGINATTQNYNHLDNSGWKIITDSSCGWEIVSPILSGESGISEVKKVSDILNRINCKVDKTCGLHVHIGADALGVKKVKSVVRRWLNNEHHLDAIQPFSRRENNNQYCYSLARTFQASGLDHCRKIETLARYQNTRYAKLNLQAYRRHSTIEFRHHSGTTDSKKITNWIKFLLDFVTTSVGNTEDNGFDALFTSNEIKRFYNGRKAKFERQLATV